MTQRPIHKSDFNILATNAPINKIASINEANNKDAFRTSSHNIFGIKMIREMIASLHPRASCLCDSIVIVLLFMIKSMSIRKDNTFFCKNGFWGLFFLIK